MGPRALAAALVLAASSCSGGRPGAGGADAGAVPDTGPIACAADHAESGALTNNLFASGGAPELTGLAIQAGGSPFTICGEIDPRRAVGQIVDADFFAFEVTGDAGLDVRIELRAPAGGSTGSLFVDLWTARRQHVGGSTYLDTHALLAGERLAPGIYLVSVTATAPAPPAPFGYELAIRENPHTCEPRAGDPDYLERDEAPGHRANDVASVRYAPAAVITPTAADDGPEPTGLTLEPGATYHLRGHSAAVAADGDDYLDRDTFEISTAAGVNELEVRLSWPHAGTDVDMDLYLFEAGDLTRDYAEGVGTRIGTTEDEHVTVNLRPGRSYWLWVATFDDAPTRLPAPYDITLCARSFEP